MRQEHVILLDAQDTPSGTLEKYTAHTVNTPLHLAFSSWLFNTEGQLLVTRRSLEKKASAATLNKVKVTKRLLSAAVVMSWA